MNRQAAGLVMLAARYPLVASAAAGLLPCVVTAVMLQCPRGVLPLALHEQACRTSRCGLRRLGRDPGVEFIYTQQYIIHGPMASPAGSVVMALPNEFKSPVSVLWETDKPTNGR